MKPMSPARALRMQLVAAHTRPRGPRAPKAPRTQPPALREARARRLWIVQSVIDATARLAWRFGLTHLTTGDCRKLSRLIYHTKRGL